MENKNQRIVKASQNLRHVGQRMLDRGDSRGSVLFKIAQSLESPQENRSERISRRREHEYAAGTEFKFRPAVHSGVF